MSEVRVVRSPQSLFYKDELLDLSNCIIQLKYDVVWFAVEKVPKADVQVPKQPYHALLVLAEVYCSALL